MTEPDADHPVNVPAASIATALIHHPYQPPAGFSAPQPGVFKASTVIFARSEEHTSELQSPKVIAYAVFCL